MAGAAALSGFGIERSAEAFGGRIGQGQAESEAIVLGRLETETAGRLACRMHSAPEIANLDFKGVVIGAGRHLDARIAVGDSLPHRVIFADNFPDRC